MGNVPYVEDDTVTARLRTLAMSHQCTIKLKMNIYGVTYWRIKYFPNFPTTRHLWRRSNCNGFLVTGFVENNVCETLDDAIDVLQSMLPPRPAAPAAGGMGLPFHMFSMRSPNASASRRVGI